MKNFLVFLILFSTSLFSQKNSPDEKIDSISYFSNLTEINIKNNKYGIALYYTQKAILYSQANKLIEEQKIQTYKLGKLYYDLKKYDDALNAFNKSLLISKSLNESQLQVYTFYYLGMCYMKTNSFDNAEICFNQATSLNENVKINTITDLIFIENGIIYKNKGDFLSAKSIFNNIIAKPDSPSILDLKAEALYQIGTIEMDENRNNLALSYFKKALEFNSKNKNLEQKTDILLALSIVYEKILDKSSAYVNLKQYNNLKESIRLLDNEKLGIDDYENFKESERAKELKVINKEKIQQEKNNKFSKLISILAIALISILSLLSLALYKNNIIRNKSNLLLEEKNKELINAKDKAIKASNARAEFLSTVSHELRTPLNAINGIAHLLLEENPKKSQLQYLESLQFSGNYLTNFINDILEINKIDSNKTQIENITFNLKELLENIQMSLRELANENDNSFTFKIDGNIPNFLIGDPTKLSQILLNLINNALKFTHSGDVSVKANLISSEDKNTIIFFEVTDTGIGIPEDKLETVFDSFSQGSVGINRKYGGTGLGLTIVKKLVKILGGNIKLESTVDKGSSFTFQLPFKISEKPLEIEVKNTSQQELTLQDKKILVVEDNKINQMVSRKMLENRGVICEIVDNGEDAIEIAKNYKYDIILMDVHLPGINGTIATKKIRQFDKKTPIIALTAISLNENRNTLLSYGMNDIITKPFIPEEFYSTLVKYI